MIDYSDYFYLSKTSPSGLRWKVNKGRTRAGDAALTAIGNGYYKGRLNQKTTYAHRVVFFLHYGYEPDVIDHIDGNGLNNSIENLRGATFTLNNQNRVVKGCYYHKRSGKFYAQICTGNRNRIFLGSFECEGDARDAYMSAKQKLHEFANMERYKC